MRSITVAGAGPAGCMAAIAARREGAAVRLFDRSRLPRHKVCGEFLSNEVTQLLQHLDLADALTSAKPAIINKLSLFLGGSTKHSRLPQRAWGLSRYRLDDLLLQTAISMGAEFFQEPAPEDACPLVNAKGRPPQPETNNDPDRLFGFKAHFSGPQNDVVELYFFKGCYVGVNPVEGGITNVCGLGPLRLLQQVKFGVEDLLSRYSPLQQRLCSLERTIDWLFTGPLVFANSFSEVTGHEQYHAGDALSFVDPFTGSGQLSAMLSGALAGYAAARGWPQERYLARCREAMESAFAASSILRKAASSVWAYPLAPLVPVGMFYNLTRPHVPDYAKLLNA